MLRTPEKRFFATIALGAKELSCCNKKSGAVLIQGRRILSYGYSRKVIKNEDWEISAIYDTLFGARDQDIRDSILFSTEFPNLEEMELIVASGIGILYFFGKADKIDAINLANKTSIEIIKLK